MTIISQICYKVRYMAKTIRVNIPRDYQTKFKSIYPGRSNQALQELLCIKIGVTQFEGQFGDIKITSQPFGYRCLLRKLQERGFYLGETGYVPWQCPQFFKDSDRSRVTHTYNLHPDVLFALQKALGFMGATMCEFVSEALEDKLLWNKFFDSKFNYWQKRWQEALKATPEPAESVYSLVAGNLSGMYIPNPYIFRVVMQKNKKEVSQWPSS